MAKFRTSEQEGDSNKSLSFLKRMFFIKKRHKIIDIPPENAEHFYLTGCLGSGRLESTISLISERSHLSEKVLLITDDPNRYFLDRLALNGFSISVHSPLFQIKGDENQIIVIMCQSIKKLSDLEKDNICSLIATGQSVIVSTSIQDDEETITRLFGGKSPHIFIMRQTPGLGDMHTIGGVAGDGFLIVPKQSPKYTHMEIFPS